MKTITILLLIILTQSCMVSLKRSNSTVKNPPPSAKIIKFEQVDADQDGFISKKEAESYNNLEKDKKSGANTSEPLIFFGFIVAAIFGICAAPKIYKFISKFFKNK